MIRLHRPAAPAALDTPAIRDYIQACAAYTADPTLPKPEPPESYRTSDLLAIFDSHFHAKCYLTEQRFHSAWSMDVDHFEPANQNPGRLYDWDNLFPASPKANQMRPRRLPAGGLLNPCTDDVERDILYTLEEFGQEPGFKAADNTNAAAVNTAGLLDRLHNGKPGDADSNARTRELRLLIKRRYDELLLAWGTYNHARLENDPQDVAQAEAKLRNLLSRRSSFTMLMRSLPFVYKRVPTHLLD